MENILAFIDDMCKKLSRPVKDLDDIRILMASLKEIRERQIDIDMTIGPIEVRDFITKGAIQMCNYVYLVTESISYLGDCQVARMNYKLHLTWW